MMSFGFSDRRRPGTLMVLLAFYGRLGEALVGKSLTSWGSLALVHVRTSVSRKRLVGWSARASMVDSKDPGPWSLETLVG